MRRAGLAITVVLAALAAAIAVATFSGPPPAPPFPCVATSKAGWLTASSGTLLVRVDWGDENRVGVAEAGGALQWHALSEPAARAQVEHLLQPLDGTVRSTTSGKVSVFVGCDGAGDYWHGEALARPVYTQCLRPPHETRRACLVRVFSERRRTTPDKAAGAMAVRLAQLATEVGMPVATPGSLDLDTNEFE